MFRNLGQLLESFDIFGKFDSSGKLVFHVSKNGSKMDSLDSLESAFWGKKGNEGTFAKWT